MTANMIASHHRLYHLYVRYFDWLIIFKTQNSVFDFVPVAPCNIHGTLLLCGKFICYV